MRTQRSHGVPELLLAILAAGVLCTTGCRQDDTARHQVSASAEISRVTVEQVQRWMDEGRALTFLDSRSEGSWRAGKTRVPGSIRVPPYEVEKHLEQIPRDRTIVAYCT